MYARSINCTIRHTLTIYSTSISKVGNNAYRTIDNGKVEGGSGLSLLLKGPRQYSVKYHFGTQRVHRYFKEVIYLQTIDHKISYKCCTNVNRLKTTDLHWKDNFHFIQINLGFKNIPNYKKKSIVPFWINFSCFFFFLIFSIYSLVYSSRKWHAVRRISL